MKKEDILEQIFQDYKPSLESNECFMEKLNQRLDAVEYIKQVQDKQIRRYKYLVIAAFVLGILCSSVLFAFILMLPETAFTFSLETEIKGLSFLEQNSRLLSLAFIAGIISFAIISIIRNIQDVINLSSYQTKGKIERRYTLIQDMTSAKQNRIKRLKVKYLPSRYLTF